MVSIIVAASEKNVIGKDNQLIWRLSADLQHFKKLTTGHHIIMGRKTYESIGKPLPNRTTVIISRNSNYAVEGCLVVDSLEKALDVSKNDNEIFITGGAEIYSLAMNVATKIYFTLVHTDGIVGDAYFPMITGDWKEVKREDFQKDEKNEYDYTFIEYVKKA